MTNIRLRNSMTRKVERLDPIDKKNVRLYVCGPTVYDRAHLGNARPAVVFDVLFRLLRHVYGPDHVTYVRNFTDVDDKINARAAETGRPISDITHETIGWYLDDMAALGVLEPTHMPRATDYITQMVDMIAGLVAKGAAYVAQGHVLFAVDQFAEYGALSGRSIEDMIAGARVEVAPYKHNPMDFVLWKPSDATQPGWDSPWGRGRPGWHIECSAMARALLGESFDIHGGGRDLMFPHHENEIAQSACAHPDADFARIWMHNEMLQVEGKKMSKSLGNFFTVRDLLDKGVPGEVMRFILLSTHYSKPMDWTEKKVEEAKKVMENWALMIFEGDEGHETPPPIPADFMDALKNNLNTPKAIAEMHKLANERRFKELEHCANLMGFENLSDYHRILHIQAKRLDKMFGETVLDDIHFKFVAAREKAMQTKDFSEVDRLKSLLRDAGVEVRMSKDGVGLLPGKNYDPDKLQGLL